MTELWIGIIIGGIITFIVAWYFYNKSPSRKEFKELKKSEQESHQNTQKLIKEENKEIKEENKLTHQIHLDNLMNIQFNRFLESKRLDKNILLRELDGNKTETLYIIKQKEGGEEKPLKERIKLLGFKNVTYGDWILPPKKLKDKTILKKEGGVKKWVEENLIKDVNLDNFVNSVVIINLSNIYDEEKGENARAKKIIGGVLKPADLISKDKLLSEIHKKEMISFREIIQLPFFDSLIDQEHPQIAEQIKELNSKIVDKIKGELKLTILNVSDLVNLTQDKLESILNSLNIKSYKVASNNILKNAKIINSYLNQENNNIKC